MIKSIVVTGHPYAFPYYFKIFEHAERKDNFIFILPKLWSAKKGKVRIILESKPGFTAYGLRAISYGGHGLKGLFKGFLPGIIFSLPYIRFKFRSKVLYSCSEPNLLTTFFNGLVAKILGMKYIFFTWQNVSPDTYMSGLKLRMYIVLVRCNLFLADGVICGNKKAEDIVKLFRPEMRTLVCPLSGVDVEKFRSGILSDWKRRLNISGNMILYCGALDSRKGLTALINAFQVLYEKYNLRNARLVIVGSGPEKEKLNLHVKSLNLQDDVTFLDWMSHDELPALLNAADVFVYPSVASGGWEEQFGYSMAEASACGIPVVSTTTGSIGEVVKDGETGILVPPEDPEMLAGAIRKILTEEGLGSAMGHSGREHITMFSHNVIASKISRFLDGFISSSTV